MSEMAKEGPVRVGTYPELTATAVIVGYFLGAIIALSIGYAALILGFSIEGSELAAILGFGILRGLMKRYSIYAAEAKSSLESAISHFGAAAARLHEARTKAAGGAPVVSTG